MANSDKNIVITPNRSLSGLPEISFTGFGNTSITLKVPDDNIGTINFEASGQRIFSINSNQSTATLFTATGSSQIPYLNVTSDGSVILTPNQGSVDIGGDGIQLPGYATSALPQGAEEGLLIYDITEKVPKIYDGVKWVALGKTIVRDGITFWVDISRKDCYNPYSNSTQVVDLVQGRVGTFNDSPSFDYRDGGSLSFDGVNDFVSWTNLEQPATEALTVCIWCYPTAIAYHHHLCDP